MINVLVFIGNYLPSKNAGGPTVSLENLVNLCHDNISFTIVTRDRDYKQNERLLGIHDGYNVVGHARVIYYKESEICFKNFEQLYIENNIDVIYVNGWGQYKYILPAFSLARKYNIPILCAPRGELLPHAYKIKAYKKHPYTWYVKNFCMPRNIHFMATSMDEVKAILSKLNIDRNKIHLIDNVPFLCSVTQRQKKRKQVNELRIVYIARIHPIKNLKYAIESLRFVKSNIAFDIYGPLEDKSYWEECKKIIAKLPKNIQVNYVGLIERNQIENIINQYHLFYMPSNTENYGQSIAEALLCYCPVLISDQTPWKFDSTFSWSFSLEDQQSFSKIIEMLASYNEQEYNCIIKNLEQYVNGTFNLAELEQKYIKLFKEVKECH